MVIAAHISNEHGPSPLLAALEFLSRQIPSLQFILFDEKIKRSTPADRNFQIVAIKPLKTNLRLRLWYNYPLPSLLKKYKAHLFISEAGITSSKTNIPQFTWLNNITFLDKKSVDRSAKDSYLRKYFPTFANRSIAIFYPYDFMKERLLKYYNLPGEKFHSTGLSFNNSYKPMEWEQKETLLNTLTGGTEYFFCECNAATKDHITTLLKAFSLFKKRLKSSFKLVLLLNDVTLEDCVKDFRLYKYREDVVVKKLDYNDDAAAGWMAASYAIIHILKEVSGNRESGIAAMRSAVPVIAADVPEYHSLYKDAAVFSQVNEQSIADNMMLLYKDEKARANYIEKGLELSAVYTLPKMAESLWQTILATLPENAQ